jgi:SAM-dependent methyltransferase
MCVKIIVTERISDKRKRSSIPVHIQNYHMTILKQVYDSGKNIYVTPKVDGVFTNCEYGGILYECEKIDNSMILLDILNNVRYSSHYTKMKMLEKIFKTRIIHIVSNIGDISNILLKYEKISLNIPEMHFNMVTKPTFVINKNTFTDDIMQTIKKLKNESVEYAYPTDGWILYTDDIQPLKLKPLEHLTIDIEYDIINNVFCSSEGFIIPDVSICSIYKQSKPNTIYRCYWIEGKWMAMEERQDKIRANKIGIILTIQAEHTGLANLDNPIYQSPYYFENEKIYNKKSESHDIRNIIFDDVVNKIGSMLNLKSGILDIGCGNGNLYRGLTKDLGNLAQIYTGIDIDTNVLIKATMGGLYLCEDINNIDFNKILKYSSNIIDGYNVTTFINSLHFCDNIPKLFEELKKVTKYVLIVGIFEDYFKGNFEILDVRVEKTNDGRYDFYYKWKSQKVTDSLLKMSDFNSGNLDGWDIIYEHQYTHVSNPFINMHKMIILKIDNKIQ